VKPAQAILVVALVAAILIAVFASGWADDRAKPGSTGRAPVSATAPR
jgi:hypothetical protein